MRRWLTRPILQELYRVHAKLETIMAAIDDLKASVARVTEQDQAIITLCTTLSQQLKDALASNDTAAIEDIANQLGAQADQVAAAVQANTPQAPTP
jgi:GTP1/Obg family GTP-binding protein